MFKHILKEASPTALVHFINGLFGKNYPPDSAVMFNATESVGADDEKLEKITSDMVLTIGEDAYLIEAQINDDENIALRVFQYGFAYARQMRVIEADESITLTMPDTRIVYWETSRRTPNQVTLRIIFPDKTVHMYEVKTFKVLEQSVEALGERDMVLLLPFYLLKFRREVKKSGATVERRRKLAERMKELLGEVEGVIERGRKSGKISREDATVIYERTAQMYRELYSPYKEFKEVYMQLEERLKIHWKDYFQAGIQQGVQQGIQQGVQQGVQQGIQQGERRGQERIMRLLEEGYTLEQIKELLANESAGNQEIH
jgi:flagellar biosynthesis/type III secretory pathway protein FliH